MEFSGFGEDKEQEKDIQELEWLTKRGSNHQTAIYAARLLRAYEIIVAQNQEIAELQGLKVPMAMLTETQHKFIRQGFGEQPIYSPWIGDPPPVNEEQAPTGLGRRAPLRHPSAREQRWDEADLQRQEDENPETPLSMSDKQDLPF